MTDSEINDLTDDFRLELTSNPPTTVGEEEDLDNLLDIEDNDTTPTHVGAVPLPHPLPMPHHPDVTTATTPGKSPLQTALLNLKIIFPIAIQAPALAIGPQPPPIPQPRIMMEPPPTAMPQLPPGLDLDGGIFRRLLTDMMYEIQIIKGMLTSILVGYYLNPFSYTHISLYYIE